VKVFTELPDFLGKKAYHDERLENLKDRFGSPKITFYSVEFTNQNRDACQCILVTKEKSLDLIVEDIERAESLASKTESKEVLKKVLEILNQEKLLSRELSGEELFSIKEYAFATAKPVIIFENQDQDALFKEIFSRAKLIFFFTSGKKESRAWAVDRGADIVAAAAKIHTDLARGFIRAEVYNIRDLENFKNLQDAKARGILKLVDRDYIVEEGDVIDIKFKV